MAKVAATLVALALIVVAATSTGGASAVKCHPKELDKCDPAFFGGATPSAACCSSLRAQERCFCRYRRNPAYKDYLDTLNSRRTLATCNIAFPTCRVRVV